MRVYLRVLGHVESGICANQCQQGGHAFCGISLRAAKVLKSRFAKGAYSCIWHTLLVNLAQSQAQAANTRKLCIVL